MSKPTRAFKSLCRDFGIGVDHSVVGAFVPFAVAHAWRRAHDNAGRCGCGSLDAIINRVLGEAGDRPSDPDAVGRYAKVVADTARVEIMKALRLGILKPTDDGKLLINRVLPFDPQGYDTTDRDEWISSGIGQTDRSVLSRSDTRRRAMACE